MIRYIRDLRLIPIALIASACLLFLKAADLMLDGSHWLAGDDAPFDADPAVIHTSPNAPPPPGSRLSWAQEMFNFPNGSDSSAAAPREIALPRMDRADIDRRNPDITGTVAGSGASRGGKGGSGKDDVVGAIDENKDGKGGADAKPDSKTDTKADPKFAKAPPPAPKGTVIPLDAPPLPSGAERAILERLQQRRQELDTRARELDMRESLIKAAEQRIDARLAELKQVEGRITVETQQKDEADAARFKGLITMYENMKPRDAAKIFDRLDMSVLLNVAAKINPRQMSEILAQMSPDNAERLTVELASKAQQAKPGGPAELPKIEGKPTAP